ncbi:MAG: NAD(P)/FAD-dependent oxidoreductase [Treponema sp.]|nr:NAD(P)/FAD-dependent oxidoreductase [Treponema sp.]MDY5124474.1 NAD(P)/FAD-dependent oxidoreductase [Treponema sp.]
MTYDVAIIGAGIIGASVARELSKYKLQVCMIEKENDVSCGTSKANSGIIHAGYDPIPGSLMAKLNVQGTAMYPKLSEELHFDFRNIGSLVVGFNEEDMAHIKKLYDRGIENGVPGMKIIDQDELRKMEPNISEEAVGALLATSAGIVSPYMATWAIAENAVENGVKLFLETEVHSITAPETTGGNWVIHTGTQDITAKCIVNAAGLYADCISKMAGARDYVIKPRRGEYFLLDNKCQSLANHTLFQTPDALGKGVLVTQTADGNILVGPSAGEGSAKDDLATTPAGQEIISVKAEKTIPNIPRRNIINSFSGIRAIAYNPDESPVNDFIIEEDSEKKGFINVGGICSPGLSAAPAIGVYVAELCEKALGTKFAENKDFIAVRKGIESFKNASNERKAQLIEENPLYGRMICRCEMITEAEIVLSIHSPVGARDLDGVKRRTRAGMGRCQSGFCSPRVTEIISREREIPMTSVTKNGGCSYILNSKTRN